MQVLFQPNLASDCLHLGCGLTNPPCRQGRLPRLLKIEDPIRVEAGAGVVAEGIKP